MRVTLTSPVVSLYGIGPTASDKLAKLGIYNIYDLITYIPRRYNDWSNIADITGVGEDLEVSIKCMVLTMPSFNPKSKLKPITFFVGDKGIRLKVTFFNQPYLAEKFMRGDEVFCHGKVTVFNGGLQLVNPYMEKVESVDEEALVKPVYSLTQGITSKQISKWVKTALDLCGKEMLQVIPEEVVKKRGFVSPEECYRMIHFPADIDEARRAREQIAYEELVLLGIGMRMSNRRNKDEIAPVVIPQGSLPSDKASAWKKITANLGFDLTGDQKNAIRNIQQDLMKDEPMNRLVQGDVGSGKTAVAILAMAMTAIMGYQSVLLAPTSVLATQHFNTALNILKGSGIECELLLGKTTQSEKTRIKNAIEKGSAKVIIGTHALLTDDIVFSDLALVIADEQHRFGVKQRSKLLVRKTPSGFGPNTAHHLVMTATPIPRTLAMVLYGDMDTTIIKEKPKGRIPVKTYFTGSKDSRDIKELIMSMLKGGDQVYIVCAKIDDETEEEGTFFLRYDESDDSITSVMQMKEKLDNWGITKDNKTGILYGPMPEKEKLSVMDKFSEGEIKILISTTVIEVGVDNPNANAMIIMDADRFGLSTLHQLRGRVGRGGRQSYCLLVSENKSENALIRMKMMCESNDGFELARKDLELRGPGDFFGTRQHGIPALRAANLYTDLELAKEAVTEVGEVLNSGSAEAEKIEKNIKELFDLRFAESARTL